jgi:hypothetical protein
MDFSMKHLMLAASLLVLQPLTSKADGHDTKAMMAKCEVAVDFAVRGKDPRSPGEAIALGQCLGSVVAIGELMNLACGEKQAGNPTIFGLAAAPAGQSPAQLAQVFINFGQANPEQWDGGIGLSMAIAFQEAFPCGL